METKRMEIRLLTAADVQAYREIRLHSLREHPEAFAAAFEEESQRPLQAFGERLRLSSPQKYMLGAWQKGNLVGMIAFTRFQRRKRRHRGLISGMYVMPNARGQGIGKALLAAVIQQARTLPDLEEIVLGVTVGNDTARALYRKVGFESSHVEPRFLKIEGQYFDLEGMTLRL
jgi:ribosomal protein S18 acetylase RimI-like enzyme